MISAKVKSYSPHTGYGFLEADEETYFFHIAGHRIKRRRLKNIEYEPKECDKYAPVKGKAVTILEFGEREKGKYAISWTFSEIQHNDLYCVIQIQGVDEKVVHVSDLNGCEEFCKQNEGCRIVILDNITEMV